jgi:hypothetical protein
MSKLPESFRHDINHTKISSMESLLGTNLLLYASKTDSAFDVNEVLSKVPNGTTQFTVTA